MQTRILGSVIETIPRPVYSWYTKQILFFRHNTHLVPCTTFCCFPLDCLGTSHGSYFVKYCFSLHSCGTLNHHIIAGLQAFLSYFIRTKEILQTETGFSDLLGKLSLKLFLNCSYFEVTAPIKKVAFYGLRETFT